MEFCRIEQQIRARLAALSAESEPPTPQIAASRAPRSGAKAANRAKRRRRRESAAACTEQADLESAPARENESLPKRRKRKRKSLPVAQTIAEGGSDAESTRRSGATKPIPASSTRLEAADAGPPHEDENVLCNDSAFAELGLPASIVRALSEIGFKEPTAIQLRAIGPALAGRDVVGQARTGTGKTAAFGLPVLARTRLGQANSALILAPTRELAHQVHDALASFGRHTGLKSALIYGGVSYKGQKQALAAGAEVIVGTPGRILDLHGQGLLKLGDIETVVLDECDRMFDLGFRPDIIKILRHTRPSRKQLMLFSATIDENVEQLAQRFMTDPVLIETAVEKLTVDRVTQHYCVVSPKRKTALLAELIRREQAQGGFEQAIVFCRTRSSCDRLAKRLGKLGFKAHAIHGDLRQTQREKVLQLLRDRKVKLLIATNVAARGLDIGGISHVFNYDVPEFAEDYVHRIGRTARMGAHGKAFSLVEPGQGGLIDEIEKLTGALVQPMQLEGFDTGIGRRVQKDPGTVSGTILFRSSHGR